MVMKAAFSGGTKGAALRRIVCVHVSLALRLCVLGHQGAKWQSSRQRGNKAPPFVCAEFNQEIN